MTSEGVWFLAGMVTGPVVFWLGVALWCWILWACRRTTGYDECVGNCGSPAREIGELPNLAVWWLQLWHRVWWSYRPSHRAAVQAYWEGLRPAPKLHPYW